MLYTTYFANVKKLPPDIIPISICGKAPSGYKGLQYKTLAPMYAFFQKWKETGDNHYYVQCYNEQVLLMLNANRVLEELKALSGGAENIALVCYEKPEDFCHRHLVSNWLRENGIKAKEFGT